MDAHGLTDAVLPELAALRGVEQNDFHHADVHGHTLEVLDAVARWSATATSSATAAVGAARRAARRRAHARRRDALRRAAARRRQAADPRRAPGRPRDVHRPRRAGAELARDVLRRLRASQRLATTSRRSRLHHLRLGFLVHERPLDRRAIWRYLRATAP